MREVKAGEFKAKCLALLDEVAATGEPIVITKRGKPVARLIAETAAARPRPTAGHSRGLITITDPNDDLSMHPDDIEAWYDTSKFDRVEGMAEPQSPPLAPKRKRRGDPA
jgi:prevent-host-death family protein